ncbi:MAG TPA: hypothetical protein VMY99_03485 [Nevskiaceae bacterium]|nr:hypothetical protein [Nevskiaceae bacterium]
MTDIYNYQSFTVQPLPIEPVENVRGCFERLLTGELPAFVLKHSDPDRAANLIDAAASQFGFRLSCEPFDLTDIWDIGLHVDDAASPNIPVKLVNSHRTFGEIGGKALFGATTAQYAELSAIDQFKAGKEINEAYKNGLLPANFINNVYGAEFNAGHWPLFVAVGSRPVFHDFVTVPADKMHERQSTVYTYQHPDSNLPLK